MIYKEKTTQKEYTFVEKDSNGIYVLKREMNETVDDAKYTEERIGIPLEVLESDFELLEEKD